MKSNFSVLVYSSCIFNITLIFYELLSTVQFLNALENDEYGVPYESHIYTLAKKETDYNFSQIDASEKKISKLGNEFFAWVLLSCTSMIFLQSKLRRFFLNGLDAKIGILPYRNDPNRRKEVNFIVIFSSSCLFCAYGNAFMRALGLQFDTIFSEMFFYILLICVVLPFLISLAHNLFRIYGSSLIVACYITFYIKAIGEFFSQEQVDKKEFERVDIKRYSREVQNFLKQQHLENKVFQEKNKSDSINAALVGWGDYEHIEIYGEHKDFNNEQFESVLMHEIGHSKDYSLHKKIFMLFLIKAFEFAFMMYLYKNVAPKYVNENLSQAGAFMIIYVIYEFYLNRYFMVFHKLTSQIAEKNADIIAKNYGFGSNLAFVLFKITIKSKESVVYTTLYNYFKSLHPTIYDRVEYLLE
ncbi:hypothetical protein NUSPORA_00366 [Nucleospora cyclopteri]